MTIAQADFALLAKRLRVLKAEDNRELRATLYLRMETILAALDIAAGVKP